MTNLLRAVLQEPRPSAPPVRVWRDWVLVAAVGVSAVLEGVLREDLPHRGLAVALAVALAPLLLWRRTHPLVVVATVFGVVSAVDLVVFLLDAPVLDLNTMTYVLVLPYALVRWGSGREAVAGSAAILVAATLAFIDSWPGPAVAFGGVAVLAAAFAVGLAVRSLSGVRQRRLEQVKAEERVLLARELHDTVAHHVSAIAVQAQAGRALAASSSSSAVDALQAIEVEAKRTLEEMRGIVRVLRDDAPADYAPQPGVADLERLSASSTLGPRVAVTVSGDVMALPQPIDSALYRIAQEAVTNARRHARRATRVDVQVSGDRSTVTVAVRDDGDTRAGDGEPEPGFGLVGMSERAAVLGGTCHAGPSPEGGWAVVATLPREVPA